MKRSAVFLDRDGTINHDTGYISDPHSLRLLAGAATAIRRLNERGIPVVVVTNQSGIARGYFSAAEYELVRARIDELLAAEGASVEATYTCPHHPAFTGPCECRKPGTLLFRRAADELDLDVTSSFYIGDKLRDVEPSRVLGGSGILVPSVDTPADDLARASAEYIVLPSLDDAVSRVIESTR